MADFFTKARIKNLIIATAIVILGIIFCAMNNQVGDVLRILAYVCGGLLMALGIILIIMYFVEFKKQSSGKNFIYGALALVAGLVLVISDMWITWLLLLAISLFLCFIGIIYMSKAFEKIRVGSKDVWKELVYGIVSFVLGIVLLILFFYTDGTALLIFAGVALIVVGLYLLVLAILGDKVTVSLKKQIVQEDKKEEAAKEEKKEDKPVKKTTKKEEK